MDLEKLTPMMQQYMEVKNKYQDTILFYRLGDFYEMFFDDALTASKVLEIALTGRNAGLEERVPMCGVPHHSSESYIKKLIDNGYKVAICEQLELPSATKKIVKRDVVKIITPGTDLNPDSNEYNFIMAIDQDEKNYYLALCDLSTGKLKALEINQDVNKLYDQIKNYQIKEVVVNQDFETNIFNELLKSYPLLVSLTKAEKNYQNNILNEIKPDYQNAFKILLAYIENMQMEKINYYLEVEYQDNQHMQLDFATKFALELSTTIKNNDKYGTLFWYLDKTKTAMGSRLLKEYIEAPLLEQSLIKKRLDFLQVLLDNFMNTEMIATYLKEVYDIARIATKVGLQTVGAKELLWLANSLTQATMIKNELASINHPITNNFLEDYNDLTNLQELIKQTISLEILEGNNETIIQSGVNEQLDNYRELMNDSTKWLIDFEQRQKDLTGIKNLKVKYNKVFGYYIEVSNANKNLIKDEYGYIRKQTLANSERYINSELKEQESLILNASENVAKLENEIFNAFKQEVNKYTKDLQALAIKLASIDVMYAFYVISNQYGFSRPNFNQNNEILIKDSFHPIIKAIEKDKTFVNNDFVLDQSTNIMLITGPNMGGKSTYMRQLAMVVILAQIGCYVPASQANLIIFDQIFTRIGANDNLLEGQSTFMVEMLEASNAINNASDNSLILFDELGRGTATYDGMSLAYAMIEYLAKHTKAKVLFSTHFHELTSLASKFDTIVNYHAGVVENKQAITFTYKIQPGQIDKSYGIHVAQLAHLPKEIIQQAYALLASLEQEKVDLSNIETVEIKPTVQDNQLVETIKAIDINNLTPLQAFNLINELKEQVQDYE